MQSDFDPSQLSVTSVGGTIILKGPPAMVDALIPFIEQIDRLSLGEPEIEVVLLKHADAQALADLLTRIYEARETNRVGEAVNRGKSSFVPVAQPNAIIVIAQPTDMAPIVEFVRAIDEESGASGGQFRVFPLKNANATLAVTKLQTFFQEQDDDAELRMRVEVVADERTNSLLVFAGPSDMLKVELLIKQLDGDDNIAVDEVRIFTLKNALASELYTVLQEAILMRAQMTSMGQTGTTGQFSGAQQIARNFQQRTTSSMGGMNNQLGLLKSAKLRLLTKDKDGKSIESGILEDVTITPDDRSNSLVVTSPPDAMSLIAELVKQLDELPNPAAELKVFTLQNADASAMLTTLETVFQQQQTTGMRTTSTSQAQQVSFTLGGSEPQLSLVPVNLAVETRTNSIIASGTANDLLAVEAVILKLDSNVARQRKTIVYKLLNLTADEAYSAMDEFLQSQSNTDTLEDGMTLQQQIASEVSVVAEPVSNSLLISSTERHMEEVIRIVEEIDTRPPQVVIQVLIAEVTLNDDEDLGLELGGQSSILFDRSLVVDNQLSPGYNFNSTNPLGNAAGVPHSDEVGLQSLTNFALSRAGSAGFGGLIFSASSENVSILMRALKRQQRLDVLSRPQVTTLHNQEANVFVGQEIPYVANSQINDYGNVINTVNYRPTGIQLSVAPRINPDGTVLLRVEPAIESLDDSGGIAVATDASGGVISTAPIFNSINAQTTVTVPNGQTVVIGGLITRRKDFDERKLPILGDWPVIGWAFKTRFTSETKSELLIVLTPHIIYNECDAERIKAVEARRIDWIMTDVEEVHGDLGLPKEPELCVQPETHMIPEEVMAPTKLPMSLPAQPGERLQSQPKTSASPAPIPIPEATPAGTPANSTSRGPRLGSDSSVSLDRSDSSVTPVSLGAQQGTDAALPEPQPLRTGRTPNQSSAAPRAVPSPPAVQPLFLESRFPPVPTDSRRSAQAGTEASAGSLTTSQLDAGDEPEDLQEIIVNSVSSIEKPQSFKDAKPERRTGVMARLKALAKGKSSQKEEDK